MNLLTQAPELFLLLQESNRVHVRQIQSMQTASSCTDTGDQSNQDDRVSGPLGIGFHRGAVDEALLKIIQTLLDNITQLDLFGLSAQASCLVCAKVADAFAISKTKRAFRPTGAIIYDLRLLSWNLEKNKVSIWAMPSRLSIPFICGDKQLSLLSYPRGQSDLIYRDGEFFLHVTVDIPDVEESSVMDLIGVDLSIANIAFDSDGNRYSGKQVNKVRHRHKSLREKLQKKRTKSAKRLLRKRKRKEQRFATDTNHLISKRIVTLAERTERGIALETLDGIRDRTRAKKDQRYRLHSWSFAQLGGFITYKAKQAGMPVIFIDPKHTSQRCNQCGYTEKANRRSRDLFVCRACGHSENADENG
jgi:putative transposase